MRYISVTETAKKWGLTGRAVRKYCSQGRIPGAFLTGKTWNVPEEAVPPARAGSISDTTSLILNGLSGGLPGILREEKDARMRGGIYHKVQIKLTYSSNHIEGSRLTEDQTRRIFETSTIGAEDADVNVDDIIETVNHFRCIDLVIDSAGEKLTEDLIRRLHLILKTGTSDSRRPWFRVGDYKQRPNEVGGETTCPPAEVAGAMRALLDEHNSKKIKTFEDIVGFHQRFEKIHPFQDGNGRVGRLIMFKECLSNDVVPFIIGEEHRWYYYRGLKEWDNDREFLLNTCLSAQDEFRKWLEYFDIAE